MSIAVGLIALSQFLDLKKDIVLDQEAFQTAAKDMNDLATQIDSLSKDIEEMLNDLLSGFDTPAGHRFVEACQTSLLEQMKKQSEVVSLTSKNLNTAISTYQTGVFQEYDNLVRTFNSCG